MFPSDPHIKGSASLTPQRVIVVIEDDAANAELLKNVIQLETSYSVFLLRSPREALRRIGEIVALSPSLFLIDHNLPTMTAFILYEHLRLIPELAHLPVIILTVQTHPHVTKTIQRSGFPILYKPLEIDDLLRMMQRYLPLFNRATALEM